MTSGTYSGATARTNVGPMANPNLMESLARAQAAQSGMVRIPSQAERDEVVKVQGMQVRTNAANFATQLFAGKAPSPQTWSSIAKVIELYIWGEVNPPA